MTSGTDPFVTHRNLLFTVAYEMLGSAADAEDVLQEVWLRWADVEHSEVREPRAYLVRITTRLALNRLRTLARRRESYVGPWLPEPLLTSPDVAEDVELADSVSTAMLLVLETLTSTGPFLRVEDGRRVWGTPAGDWRIDRKRPTRHMAGDDLAASDFFDLPGVPWVSYFHWWGVSIHGTYWHNDYGRARSHGCVNLLPQTAKWVFRWSQPVAPPGQLEFKGEGTPVIVY